MKLTERIKQFIGHKIKNQPPHVWYPEILHWQVGDKLFCWNILYSIQGDAKPEYHKYRDSKSGVAKDVFTYQSVDKNGVIIVKDKNEQLLSFNLYHFIEYGRNDSLKTRQLNSKIKETEDYMELMGNFQQAYKELQSGEKHPTSSQGDGNSRNT